MKLFKKAKKGFTLVELVVVIAVIAILAAVSVGAYFGVTESAKNSQVEQESKAFHTALLLVVSDPDNGYTSDKNGIVVKDTADALVAKVEGTTGLEYGDMITFNVTAVDTDNNAETAAVDYWTSYTYALDESHSKTISIASGEFVDA